MSMNTPIEGLREEKIDGRTKEGRAMRAGMRPDEMRAESRPDSVREAELRAQEILDSLDGSETGTNELNIPANLAPPGWRYQLRAETVAGMENRHHMLGLYRTGWRPVPASRHPWLMPAGHEGPIVIKGLMLMELPEVLVEQRYARENREALDQLRNSEKRLSEAPPNTAPRDNPLTPTIVNREIMRPMQGDERRKTEE
jgi:hypothetical protein